MMKSVKRKLTNKYTRQRLNPFLKEHGSNERTLDVGCGGTSGYREFFPNRIGVDAKDGPGVDVVGDAHNLPFKNEEFKVVICIEVLEHLHSPNKAVHEMQRVLEKGGTLILTTRFIFPLHGKCGDYYRYTPDSLNFLLKDGWKVKKIIPEATPKNTMAILSQRAGYRSDSWLGKAFWFVLAALVHWFPYDNESYWITSGYYVVATKT